ncbi:hypothetical protein [Gordonia insulae]|uniref:CobQ/CobB/MinD/ParA nucleotide binding domain-containing protein n=1 Tax=Gordonia insulae TaxID=2420509 RepID=A0A3G8JPM5_9ACTN|nr:hypothetical protein [Gordonia insulae]AZG47041.1 hypothetical protein D7316_03648 [Gordonia insulae]
MSEDAQSQQPDPIHPPNTAERSVVVCGTAGGVGASVVSALLAEYRAARSLGGASWWVDAAGNDGDLHQRLRATGDQALLRTASGTGLLPAPDAAVTDVVLHSWRFGAVPVVDAGARPLTVLSELEATELQSVTPVLVAAPRPDLLNRAREIFTEWDHAGVLGRTIVVICCQVPTLNHQALTDMLIDVVSGKVAGVIGLDYEPVLGDGTAVDTGAQERFSQSTWGSLEQLAALTRHTHTRAPI